MSLTYDDDKAIKLEITHSPGQNYSSACDDRFSNIHSHTHARANAYKRYECKHFKRWDFIDCSMHMWLVESELLSKNREKCRHHFIMIIIVIAQ